MVFSFLLATGGSPDQDRGAGPFCREYPCGSPRYKKRPDAGSPRPDAGNTVPENHCCLWRENLLVLSFPVFLQPKPRPVVQVLSFVFTSAKYMNAIAISCFRVSVKQTIAHPFRMHNNRKDGHFLLRHNIAKACGFVNSFSQTDKKYAPAVWAGAFAMRCGRSPVLGYLVAVICIVHFLCVSFCFSDEPISPSLANEK